MSTPGSALSQRPAVWACIVCYQPQADALREMVASLQPQVDQVLVIDNAPGDPALLPADLGQAVYIPMTHNAGTAGAMNEAWRLALDAGVAYLVSFDQDSQPGPGLIECLLTAISSDHVPPLAAVGPAWVDARTQRTMRLLRPVRFLRRHVQAPVTGLVEVDHVITSGCLISAQAYRAVGPFNEDLFLDYVDVEWSLRARAAGYTIAIAAGCVMRHAIGERMIALAGRQLAIHKPQRNYLQLRNHLLLWRNPAIARAWLLSDLVQVVSKLTALIVLAPERLQRLGWIFQGLADGLRGKRGPPVSRL